MASVENFRELRADGQVIEEGMEIEDIRRLGPISRVVAVLWESQGQTHRLLNAYAKRVAGGELIASVNSKDDTDYETTLTILAPDGSIRACVANMQSIGGEMMQGNFRWFEPPRSEDPAHFGVIFELKLAEEVRMPTSMYQLDIDAATGEVLGVHPTR